jgi:hypothetical protein
MYVRFTKKKEDSHLHRVKECLFFFEKPLKNAWWGMSDAERGTSDADGSMAFCRGKAWL